VRPLAIAPGLRNRLAFWALAGLALFVAHDAIFLAQLGPGRQLVGVLRTAGHGYWTVASLALVAVALLAAIATTVRLRRLQRRATALAAAPRRPRAYVRRLAGAWWRLALVVAVGFAIQENLEHVLTHGHAPGLGVLAGPEYPLALPIIGLVTGAAAAVAALVSRTQQALVEAIEAALRSAPRRAPRALPHPPVRLVAISGSILATRGAGRAPPALVHFAT
jgi:hypothetical protein